MKCPACNKVPDFNSNKFFTTSEEDSITLVTCTHCGHHVTFDYNDTDHNIAKQAFLTGFTNNINSLFYKSKHKRIIAWKNYINGIKQANMSRISFGF